MTLLPPNATAFERAAEATLSRPVAMPADLMWDPATCPEAFLPWLAWALSVDDWDASWSVERKREVIAASVDIHRHKGTVWAMRRALQVAGLGDAELIENYGFKFHDGALLHDGSQTHGAPDHWAEYRVVLTRPLTIAQADRARAILEAAAPARCHLKAMDFTEAAAIHNAAIRYDGEYSHGVA